MMKRIAGLVAVVALCGCSESINPSMKSATDAQLAAIQGSARNVKAPRAYPAPQWEVGQWVLYRAMDEKGEPSILRTGVVAHDSEGYWLETDIQDYRHRTMTKVLYSRQPRSIEEAADLLLKVVSKLDDRKPNTTDFRDPAFAMAKSIVRSSAQGMFFPNDLNPADVETANVPAGAFSGCAKAVLTMRLGFVTSQFTGCVHPSVPVNGVVKGTTQAAGKTIQYALLDYGSSGATSTF